MGYAGGTTPSPTYRRIGDHAEMVELEFDPSIVSYDALLDLFWAGHDPLRSSQSQYRAELVCHDATQYATAMAYADRIASERGRAVQTRILQGRPFYEAEDYHQKWRLRRQEPLFDALRSHYDSERALLHSTAAAKLNAHVAGHWASDGMDPQHLGLTGDALRLALRFNRPVGSPLDSGRRAS